MPRKELSLDALRARFEPVDELDAQFGVHGFEWVRATRYLSSVESRDAKFEIGQVVKHRIYPFRGVIFDVDPTFSNTEQWWQAIPAEVRPRKDQPYYHLLAENEKTSYIAYVSEQNLLPDETGQPVQHPQVVELFGALQGDRYALRAHRVQ